MYVLYVNVHLRPTYVCVYIFFSFFLYVYLAYIMISMVYGAFHDVSLGKPYKKKEIYIHIYAGPRCIFTHNVCIHTWVPRAAHEE